MSVEDTRTQSDIGEVNILHKFGYHQRLRRSMRLYSSFSLAFAEIAITVTVFTLFSQPFQTLGGVAIWFWVPVTAGGLLIASIWGHLTARIPVTGYAYSWVSRIVSIRIGRPGDRRRISRHAVIPPMPGMFMSRRTAS